MMNLLLLFSLFYYVNSFKCVSLRMSSDTPPPVWKTLSRAFKDSARNWFVNRAEAMGIDWKYLVENNKRSILRIEELRKESTDYTMEYPSYFTQPFHGYEDGNLNWDAALECEPATLNMAASYWKQINPITTQDWLRYNVSKNIKSYITNSSLIKDPYMILDVGCSIGISSEYLHKSFRNSEIEGVDLSPYFIAMAKFRAEKYDFPINYYHRNAEYTHMEDKKYGLTVCSFVMHELPESATINILEEMKRVLIPGGTIAIVDLTPKTLKSNFVTTFRKWAFEVTEPHIYGYYERDMKTLLTEAGFINVKEIKNDPMNSVWLASKF